VGRKGTNTKKTARIPIFDGYEVGEKTHSERREIVTNCRLERKPGHLKKRRLKRNRRLREGERG